MNSIDLFKVRCSETPEKIAFWFGPKTQISFRELERAARSTQKILREFGVESGDTVLLMDTFGLPLYGALIGAIGLGAKVIFVEPWMPIANIDHVVNTLKPKVFLASLVGRVWGARISAVRKIPGKASIRSVLQSPGLSELQSESVPPEQPAIITFTTGTTGKPKGVVRTHRYLVDTFQILQLRVGEGVTGPDLCIFANFALINLAAGRTTLMIPPSWPTKTLRCLENLPSLLQPQSITCGPAFLKKLMQHASLPALRSGHVGGALTDCDLFEQAFEKYPRAHWSHLYGSSEAEPVALADARLAVKLSRELGYFQTLYLGKPIPEIAYEMKEDGIWVTGANVCPSYVSAAEENRLYKRIDEQNRCWHSMGDRITSDLPSAEVSRLVAQENIRAVFSAQHPWWYSGRSQQPYEDFVTEQSLYALVKSSEGFLHRTPEGERVALGVGYDSLSQKIRSHFPDIGRVHPVRKIHRDPRHRARINRPLTLQKEARWLVAG